MEQQQNNKIIYENEKCDNDNHDQDENNEIIQQQQQEEEDLNENINEDDEEIDEFEKNDEVIKSGSLDKSDSIETPENNSDGSDVNSGKYHQNGTSVPPKPMPRTSRTNSVSDQGNEELTATSTNGTNVIVSRPIARPRTTASGYKVLINVCTMSFFF